jgi:hypothetical protein
MSASTEIKRGVDALTYFHNRALRYPENYSISFDDLKIRLSEVSKGQFLSGFGFAIENSELSERDVRESMERLADAGAGKIPSRWNDFFNALHREPSGFSFDALVSTVKSTASDIGSGLKQVGDVSIDTLKNAGGYVKFLPMLAFLGIGAYIWFRVKK